MEVPVKFYHWVKGIFYEIIYIYIYIHLVSYWRRLFVLRKHTCGYDGLLSVISFYLKPFNCMQKMTIKKQ